MDIDVVGRLRLSFTPLPPYRVDRRRSPRRARLREGVERQTMRYSALLAAVLALTSCRGGDDALGPGTMMHIEGTVAYGPDTLPAEGARVWAAFDYRRGGSRKYGNTIAVITDAEGWYEIDFDLNGECLKLDVVARMELEDVDFSKLSVRAQLSCAEVRHVANLHIPAE